METFIDPKNQIEREFLARRRRNPQYSLRAFARLLELSPGRLSQLLSEKRRFTEKSGRKIALRLGYNPKQTEQFISGINKCRDAGKIVPENSNLRRLDMDHFETISDPLHFSLLSLIETKNFSSDIRFISRRLGVSSVEARGAVERLERVGLIDVSTTGKISLSNGPGLTTSHDVQSTALRHSHKKVLEESIEALEAVEVELRDITSMTMAIDVTRMGELKKKIKDFRRSLCAFAEAGEQTEVYRLNIQFVPVSRKEKK